MTSAIPNAGSAALSVGLVAGESAVTTLWSANPLKILASRMRGPSVWAYLASMGGGMVAGDETALDLRLGPGARCFLSTQASTKIYRNPQRRPCGHRLAAHLGCDALLVLAPDPVQSFADSSYAQSQVFHLERGAGLALLDWFSAGRAARGERWSFHRLSSRNDIFLEGERRLLDSLLLDRAHGPLDSSHRLGRFHTVALVALIGAPMENHVKTLLARVASQPIARGARLIFSVSPIRSGAILRVAGESHEEVARHVFDALGFVSGLLGEDPWAGKLN